MNTFAVLVEPYWLFTGNADEDDDMFYIDMQTVQKVLDEDDDCYFQEVGFLLCQKQSEIPNAVIV